MRRLIMFLIVLFFVGCGGESEKNFFNLSYTLENVKAYIGNDDKTHIGFNITFSENNPKFKNISFEEVNITDNSCNIESKLINQLNTNTFFIQVNYSQGCKSLSPVVSVLERGEYVDTELKEVSRVWEFDLSAYFSNISLRAIYNISFTKVSSVYNSAAGMYEDTYTIQATDLNGNPATFGDIEVGALVGYYVDNNGNIKYKNTTGVISYNGVTEFNDSNGIVFDEVKSNDILVVYAYLNKIDSEYLGGWYISEKSEDNKTLYLRDDYNGVKEENLSYLVGKNSRANLCTGAVESVQFNHPDKIYSLDSNGSVQVIISYPPYLVGKTISLFGIYRGEKRVGGSMKVTLEGSGITPETLSCDATNSSGDKTCILNIPVKLNNSNEYLKLSKLSNFVISGCSEENYTINSQNLLTDCNGTAEINISVKQGVKCDVTVSNILKGEY